MTDKLDPKEAKILADILALTLDEQPGASMTALQKIQQRARQDGITGGALKNIFSRVASDVPRASEGRGAPGGTFNATQLRSTIAAQAASISLLEQRVALLQARLSQTEASRRQEREELMWSGRRLSIKTAVVGLVLGAVLTGLVAYMLPAPPAMPAPVQTTAQTVPPAPPRPAARIAPPNSVASSGANSVANSGQQPGFATATGIPRPGDIATQATDPGFVPPSRDPTDSAPGPEYPPDAARRGQEGVVQLLVYVETDGHVAAIAVARGSGFPDLDVAAEQAVRQWHFRPATRDGVPVANSTTVTMRFILHR